MAVVADASIWIEWLLSGQGSERYSAILANPEAVLVPAITIYEVVRWSLARRQPETAQAAAALMRRGMVVELDADLAAEAALLAHNNRLAMADAIMLATARAYGAELWTQDADFAGLPGVRYFEKPLST